MKFRSQHFAASRCASRSGASANDNCTRRNGETLNLYAVVRDNPGTFADRRRLRPAALFRCEMLLGMKVREGGIMLRVFIPCAAAIGLIVLLSLVLMNMKSGNTIILNDQVTDTSRVNAEDLEREVRTGLPTGSSLRTVDEFLAKREIEHSFDAPSKTVYAVVKRLKGSSILARKSLTFQLHFDDSLKLKSIDTKVVYTGP
ncbi:MAG: hypothetical protein WAJ92_05700 [Candidatus Acidiferrales bacterium]